MNTKPGTQMRRGWYVQKHNGARFSSSCGIIHEIVVLGQRRRGMGRAWGYSRSKHLPARPRQSYIYTEKVMSSCYSAFE